MDEQGSVPGQQPVYRSIEEKLRNQIVSGRLRDGDLLPKQEELAEHYHTSIGTIRKAVQQLANEHLVKKVRHKGTFVTSFQRLLFDHPEICFEMSDLLKTSLAASTEMISCAMVLGPQYVRKQLHIPENDGIQQVKRLISIADLPHAVDTIYAPSDRLPGLLNLLTADASLHDLLESSYGLQIKDNDLTLRASTATSEEAMLLSYITGGAILSVDHVTLLSDNLPITFSHTIWRADDVSFHFRSPSDDRDV